LNNEVLSIIPLGGLGEIGLNTIVMEYGDDIIVIDAGQMFPEEDMLGVDIVIPDFSYLLDNKDKIRGVILTHGHEDHTGALPYLLRQIRVPVYGTLLTIGLVKETLKEHGITGLELYSVKPRDIIHLGSFAIEFIRVTHSIVDGVGLGITTPIGRIVHTGDFKLDPTPVDGELMDFHKFSEYGDKGTLVFLSDSTNAEKGGYTFSEKEVRRALEDIFSKAEKRIIVATFSSNIHRIQQIIDVAVMFGRKVILNGKSMISNAQISLELGYLKIPKGTWLRIDEIKRLQDHEIVIVTTGSQGEPLSALSRIAMDEHKHIKIQKGDTVVLSAKMIPGNERAIARVINHLLRRGADVIYEKVSEIHVSGHASKEELKLMLNIVRPKYFIPIHGEYRHLIYHSKLAEKTGVSPENIFILQDGDVVEFGRLRPEAQPEGIGAWRAGSVTAGRVFIDGKGIGDVEDVVLRDRLRLAHDGVVIVIIGIEKLTGKVITGPDIISRGFVFEDASQDLLTEVKEIVTEALESMGKEIKSEWPLVQANVKNTLRKYIYKKMERKPMILPLIIEV
jgi:ribonuclease J